MKGDFSRIQFDTAKQYSAVLQQQGRVALDADANEQSFIDERLRDTANTDMIGRFGGPVGHAGFQITFEGGTIVIGTGRYYLDGVLVENPKSLSYEKQPCLDVAPLIVKDLLQHLAKAGAGACLQLTLEVWERLVTALDDPCLLEPALGQADTTARLQTVWRVLASVYNPPPATSQPVVTNSFDSTASEISVTDLQVPAGCSNARNPIEKLSPCCQLLYQKPNPSRSGAMGADTATSDDCGCQPIPSAGYQGLENQLYRVEIHHAGTLETATYKWSRENGSVVARVTDLNGAKVTVSSLGPDANLGFQSGQWVELSDDRDQFAVTPNRPGNLYQILSVQHSLLEVTLTTAVTGIDTARNARMRRWDQSGATANSNGLPLSATATQLENGIEVTFHKGHYIAGDYWTIPARTASGEIEWPPCGGDNTFFQPANFIKIYAAPLACIRLRDGDFSVELQRILDRATLTDADLQIAFERLFLVDDCRLLFPPLTALCGGSQAAALHVQSTNWINDSIIPFDQLIANGLVVTLDQAPTSSIISGANFSVTFEIANIVAGMDEIHPAPQIPSTVARSTVIVDSDLKVVENTLSWQFPFNRSNNEQLGVVIALGKMVFAGAPVGWFTRVRVRLVGRSILSSSASGQIYLDGQTFGQLGLPRADGSTSVVLQLPSGNGEKASDFESWFYLAPVLNVSVAVQYSALIIETNANGVAIATAGQKPVNPTATVTVNYPAIAATTVNLVLVSPLNVIQIQTSVVISANSTSSQPIPIVILSNPGPIQPPLSFQIIASLPPPMVGQTPSGSAQFTVTGTGEALPSDTVP